VDFFVELTKIKHCKRLTKVCGCALVVFDVSSHPAGIVFDRTRGKVRSVVGVDSLYHTSYLLYLSAKLRNIFENYDKNEK
jgi:hypothetical protein